MAGETVDDRIVMIVEDNPNDAALIIRALRHSSIENPIFQAKDGLDALHYLMGTGRYEDRDSAEMPAIVLIDLNLPRMDGLELLRRMRANYRTKLVPVVIFTGSSDEQDLINGYTLGANSYVRKPIDGDQFASIVQRLVGYWIALNEAPPPGQRTWAHHFDPNTKSA
jgi:two-component system, response regulator